MTRIESRSNPRLRSIRALRRAGERKRQGRCWVDGIAPALAALEHATVEAVVVAPELLTSTIAGDAVDRARRSGIDVIEVGADAFASLSERDDPVGLGVVVATPVQTLDALDADLAHALVVVLYEPSGPGNVGTIVRTADAAGCAGVVLVGGGVDPWHPAAIKASMGAVFSTPIVTTSPEQLWAWAGDKNADVVTTSAHASTLVWDAAVERPALLVLGNERHGLPPDVVARGRVALYVPMAGTASSLNLAVAAGIAIYELQKSVLQAGTTSSSQSPIA